MARRVQLTLSIYLVGFAVGQIFYGPISDKIGRKPTVLAGLSDLLPRQRGLRPGNLD